MLGYANIGAYAKGVALAFAEESLSMNDTQLDAFIKEKLLKQVLMRLC